MDERRWSAKQSRDGDAWGICTEESFDRKPDWIIYPTKTLSTDDAAIIMASHNARVDRLGKEHALWVNSITNTRYEPIIELVIGDEAPVQLNLRQAQDVAQHLDQAIEASQSDALLCRFIRDYIFHGEDSDECKHAIGHMLVMFRDMRKAMLEPVIEAPEA